jgi:protein O-GlcNAc transferase
VNDRADLASRFAEGVSARAQWNLDAAEDTFRALCDHAIARPRALTELAVTLSLQGRGARALQAMQDAVALAPHDATIRQNALVLEKLREPGDPERFVAMHRQWGADFAPPGGAMHAWTLRDPDPERRLRIAYLGVDAHTALTRFMPLLARHHDAGKFDVFFVYRCNSEAQMAVEQQSLPTVRHLHAAGVDARTLARTLALLQIDIAIDICGHGVGHVLEALALRPAPLQLTWLDYVATTGVAAIDGRIADAITDPPASDWPEVASEPTLRLPFAQWCCTPHPRNRISLRAEAPPVFGLVNATNKVTPALMARAERLLEAVPQARLRVIGVSGVQGRACILGHVAEPLRPRIEIIGRVPEAEFQRLLGGIDVALDPLVFSGATSTLDCLWAGIPVITEPGVLPHTRSSASILHTLNLQQWIAGDGDAFVAIAAALAMDAAERARWRSELPQRLRVSSLCDGGSFVAALERLLRDAWRNRLSTADPLWSVCLGGDATALKQLLVERANAAVQAGDLQQIIYALETLALVSPSDAVHRNLSRAWNNRGVARRKSARLIEADADFRTALEVWPENPEARDNLGTMPLKP